ncbi:MAG: hypothetical protein AB1813_01165 [Verrucomicrobiota bacterium]
MMTTSFARGEKAVRILTIPIRAEFDSVSPRQTLRVQFSPPLMEAVRIRVLPPGASLWQNDGQIRTGRETI